MCGRSSLPRSLSRLPTCSGRVRLNEWNSQFFDAVGRRDLSACVHFVSTLQAMFPSSMSLTRHADLTTGAPEISAEWVWFHVTS